MPLSLADLIADRRQLTLTYLGQEVTFTYKPAGYTAEIATNGLPFADFVVALVTEWDVLGDDGDPIPINDETVATLPQRFLRAVSIAIRDDVNLGEAEGS